MQSRSSFRQAVVSALVLGLILGSSLNIFAQDNRPRRSSRQSPDNSWTIPQDSVISVRMNGTLSSKTSHVGDRFNATVDMPVYVNGREVIPAGAIVEGRVTQVTPAKRMGRSGTIAIDFDDLVFPDGSRIDLDGNLTSDDPETRERIDDESRVSGRDEKRTGVFVGGGGAIGAVLGGIAGGGKGAVVGGVLGAGAGIAGVLLSKGEEAQVPSGTPFGVQLRRPIVLREGNPNQQDTGGYRNADQNADPVQDPQRDRSQPPDLIRNQPTEPNPNDSIPDSREPEPEPRTEPAEPSGPPLPLSSPEMITRAQVALKSQGYYEGEVNGTMSARTSNSLKAFQRENNLPESGELDPPTAKKLGILGASSPVSGIGSGSGHADRPVDRPTGGAGRPVERTTDAASDDRTVMANVLSASANRTAEGAVYVLINTQANTGGWRWFGEHVVNGDTLEVYARAVRPTGMVTQGLTRGKIELKIMDGVEYVRRVIIHSAGADQAISLGSNSNSSSGANSPRNANSGADLQRKAEDLMAEYQRLQESQSTGSRESGVELLFALDNFANATRLYARLVPSMQSQQSLRSATLALARQARRTDLVITSTDRVADSITIKWDAIRQDVLHLMQTYNIAPSELND
ncbi:MAG: peptidoglycan-binding protein [Blastocatellia bacterium]